MWIGNEWVTRSSGREPVREVAEDKAELYAKLAEMAEEAAQVELEQFGFIEPPDDIEELEDFAAVAGWVHHLEAEFDNGRIGGAELAEYDECLTALYSMLG